MTAPFDTGRVDDGTGSGLRPCRPPAGGWGLVAQFPAPPRGAAYAVTSFVVKRAQAAEPKTAA